MTSPKNRTAPAGNRGLTRPTNEESRMAENQHTCVPVDTLKIDNSREPVSIGDALAEAMPKIRPLAHNMTLRIEHDDPEGPITTLGSLRAATAGLADDTPVWVVTNEQYEFFEGLQIGGER